MSKKNILRKVNNDDNILLFLNNNNTVLYKYNIEKQEITHIFKDKWSSSLMEVITNEGVEKKPLKDIINGDNDFIKVCEVISSTLKPIGYFDEIDEDIGLTSQYLNEFIGGKTFLESLSNPIYTKDQNPIELLEKETPHINTLLRNLFFNESDEVIQNFLNWLNVVSFKDRHQDIIFSFFGTNEINQGQGGGKGVLISLLTKMFSGLVVSVSNNTYSNNFNSRLQNKKIVIFDEVDYKSLKYETIKDITGNGNIQIEYKGKESITSKNVSSWLMFSNMFELHNKITMEDRRVFLIRPNPKNNSLPLVVKEKHNIDISIFVEEKIMEEVEKFIHIVSLSDGVVLPPNKLRTKTHQDYFNSLNRVSVSKLDSLYRLLLIDSFKSKVFEILDFVSHLKPEEQEEIKTLRNIISLNIMTPRIFFKIFQLLKEGGYITTKNEKVEWEHFKENILNNQDWEYVKINMSETKVYKRFVEYVLIKKTHKEDTKQFKKLQNTLRNTMGIKH